MAKFIKNFHPSAAKFAVGREVLGHTGRLPEIKKIRPYNRTLEKEKMKKQVRDFL